MPLQQYRAIATRYNKLKRNDDSMMALICGGYGCPCKTLTTSGLFFSRTIDTVQMRKHGSL